MTNKQYDEKKNGLRWQHVGDTAAARRSGEVGRCGRPDEAKSFPAPESNLTTSL